MKTFSLKQADVSRKWHIIDASDTTLGRLSTVAASLLLGKGKPSVTSHVDNGDFIVIINSDNLKVSGNKLISKSYFRHTGHPGALHERSLEEQMKLDSTKVILTAVRGMLPDNKLRAGRLARLKIYTGSDHPHAPQQPSPLSLKEKK